MNDGKVTFAITNQGANSSTQELHFATEDDAQLSVLKENYYKWLARLVTLFAIVALTVFTSSVLVLFHLVPRLTVEPFLILKQYDSEGLIRYEPIANDMASHKMFMEVFVKQYVIMRNTFIHDLREMQIRWYPGGWVHFLSGDDVFKTFSENIEEKVSKKLDSGYTVEVEIISVQKQGGENSPVWKVDFKTYEIGTEDNEVGTERTVVTKYWTASLTAYFVKGRELMSKRLMNPLGFTVVRYSQTEVEVL